MGKVFADQSISLDGFSAGPNVGVSNPMGDGGEELHAWQIRLNCYLTQSHSRRSTAQPNTFM